MSIHKGCLSLSYSIFGISVKVCQIYSGCKFLFKSIKEKDHRNKHDSYDSTHQ